MKKFLDFLSKFLFIAFLAIIILGTYFFYKKFYFGEFTKAQLNKDGTSFYREDTSFCIENETHNDALFYKKVNVEKNTAYRVSYKVKTENVVGFLNQNKIDENESHKHQIGAVVGIMDSNESSESIVRKFGLEEYDFYF